VKNGKNSKYADWFEIEQWPDSLPAKEEDFGTPGGLKFKAWDKDSGSLPVFKKDDKLGLVHGPREHVLAIAQRWLAPDGDPSKGIDGWRLDVPGDIPHPFWVEFRKVVHNAKPDAYITGEVWPWAQAWLNSGDQFDAVMNYRFADAAQKFFVNNSKALKPSEMNAYCIDMEFNYPLQVALSQMNLFDSHDTDRAASMYVNPDLEYDASNRIEDNNPKYNPRKPNETEWTRMRQAVDFQMTFIGGPMIYYGDETGMFGPDDPSNRMPMVWKDLEPYDNKDVKFDQTQFDRYVRDIAVREALVPLQVGFYRPVITDNDHGVLAFARDYQGKSVYVIVNRSSTENRVELPVAKDGTYIDWFDSNEVEIKPMSSAADARPTAVVQSDAKGHAAQHGKIVVELKPYSSMVLSEK
jgi:cyclomaltodextrinase / maltogenic alpha-amylase / neopullulanase